MNTRSTPEADPTPASPGSRRHGMVVGLDGSPGSDHALAWAATRTAQFGPIRPVTTWHYPWWAVSAPMPGAPLPPPTETFATTARDEALRAVAGIPEADCEEPVVRRAMTGPALIEEGADAKLIVVGTRGRGAVADTLLGSVSSHVVAHAGGPVAVVPPDARLDRAHRRVVVGIDGSANSVRALTWAIETTADDDVLEVIYVWNYTLTSFPEVSSIPVDHFEIEARQTLDQAVVEATLAAGGTRHEIVHTLQFGDPRDVLRDASSEADLLVLGARGHEGVAHVILGSVTTALAHRPLTTTIIVPAKTIEAASTTAGDDAGAPAQG